MAVRKQYPVIRAGQPVRFNWRKTTLYFACCDCSLVHSIVYDIAGDVLTMRTWREKKETARLRKRDGIVYTVHPVKPSRRGTTAMKPRKEPTSHGTRI